MEYAPIKMAFNERKDGTIQVREKNYNDRVTNESKINKKFDNWYLTMSDFQKVILNAQHKKLVEKSRKETQDRIENSLKKNLLNLSIHNLYTNINHVMIMVLNEFTILLKNKKQIDEDFFKQIFMILTKNDRLFYVGIVFCIIGICIFILQSSST
jgi:hypothetical protein